NEALRLKNQEIQELTNRLVHFTAEQEATASQTAEELGRLSGQLRVSVEDLKSAFSDKNAQMIQHVQDLEGTVGLQRKDIEQFKEEIRELDLLRTAADEQNTALRLEIESVRSRREDTLRRLREVEAHAQQLNAMVGEKDGAILELTSRFAELSSAAQEAIASQTAEELGRLSGQLRVSMEDLKSAFSDKNAQMIQHVQDLEGTVGLHRKDIEQFKEQIRELELLRTAADEQNTAMWLEIESVRSQRDDTSRRLREVEAHAQQLTAMVGEKDGAILELTGRFAELSSAAQEAIASQTAEELGRLSGQLRVSTEDLKNAFSDKNAQMIQHVQDLE